MNKSESSSDELFELIQSLSKTERRYFKIHFTGTAHGDLLKYVKLFDAMAAMDHFDERALQKKFGSQQIWKYYSKTKHYLSQAIFDAMRSFYRGHSLRDELYESAADIRFLLNRGLTSQFRRQLQATKALCYEVEILGPLLDILETEEGRASSALEDTQPIHVEIQRVLALLREDEAMTHANRQVYDFYKQHGLRPNDRVRRTLRAKLKELRETRGGLQLRSSTIMCNSAIGLCHHMLGEQPQGIEALQCNITLLEASPLRFYRQREVDYGRILANMMTYAYTARDLALFETTMAYIRQKLSNVKGSETVKFELNTNAIFLEVSLKGDYSAFRNNAKYVEENLETLKKIDVVRRGDLTFNVSLGYLKTGAPTEALRWLLLFFEVPNIEQRTQVYLYSRLYEILLHWKLNNTDLVLSKTLSFKRYLSKREMLNDFESAFVRFMNAAVNNDSTAGFTKAMRNFGEDLQKLDATQYAGIVSNYTHLLQTFST